MVDIPKLENQYFLEDLLQLESAELEGERTVLPEQLRELAQGGAGKLFKKLVMLRRREYLEALAKADEASVKVLQGMAEGLLEAVRVFDEGAKR